MTLVDDRPRLTPQADAEGWLAAFEAALPIYEDGLAKLDLIVAKYPASNLAVQLASGQMIGNFKIYLDSMRIRQFACDLAILGFVLGA